MTRIVAWSCVGLVVVGNTSAFAVEAIFRYTREIEAAARQQEEMLSVPLDAHVFAGTRDGVPDLRILDSHGSAVPYLLRQSVTAEVRTTRHTWTERNLSLRPLEGGGLEITAHLEPRAPAPQGFRLITPLRDFEQRIRVFSSDDGATWEPLGDETLIFDYSRYMDVRNDGVAIPATVDRYLRIVVNDVTTQQESDLLELTRHLRGREETERVERIQIDRRPFRIDRVEFWNESRQERAKGARTGTYPASVWTIENDPEGRRTIISVETGRAPITSFTVVTGNRNFSRRAVVEVPESLGARTTWRPITKATISRIHFGNVAREQVRIDFPESRRPRHRIVIENGDSPPLEITDVKSEGFLYELDFLAAPGDRYRLVYGAEHATTPNYDTAALETLLQSGYAPVMTGLAESEEDPRIGGSPDIEWSRFVNDPWILVPIVLALVAAVGWGLYRAGRKFEQLPPP